MVRVSNLLIRREKELQARIITTAPAKPSVQQRLAARTPIGEVEVDPIDEVDPLDAINGGAMKPLEHAITRYVETRSEADHWQIACSDWMKTHGRRHSYTFNMLAHRRLSRHCLRAARCQLEEALENWCPYQTIMDDERSNYVPHDAQHLADLANSVIQ
jgi:hypothetical protein